MQLQATCAFMMIRSVIFDHQTVMHVPNKVYHSVTFHIFERHIGRVV